MSGLHEERAELAEDEEKLQTALREYEWSEEEEDDEEDCLLIDLELEDKPISTSDITGRSISPSFAESGSQVNGEDESADGPSAPELPEVSSKEAEISEAEKTLALNRALQGILEKHMDDIRLALDENKQKQEMLEDGCWMDDSVKQRKGRTFGPFRTPFFQNGVSFPPVNEDVKLKKSSGELTFEDMHESMTFNQPSRASLMEGVLENLREEFMKPLMTRLESEVKKGKDLDKEIDELEDSLNCARENLSKLENKTRPQKSAKLETPSVKGNVKKLTREIKELEQNLLRKRRQKKDQSEILAAIEDEMEQMKKRDFTSALRSLDVETVDWMKISKMRFGEKTSWLDCRKEWEHTISPSLNQEAWTKSEDKRLVDLVKEHPSGKWDVIAKELGTNRTPFMCLNHYQRCLNPEFKSRPWTPEEDAHMLAVAKNMRENSSFFSWRKVSALVESRSYMECMNRFARLDERMSHGRWSKEEDARLLAAVEIVGPSWTQVSHYLPHRTAVQIRDRYVNCLDPNLNFSCFTYDEDAKLLRLYKQGVSWSNISKNFEGRTDSMLFSRYKTLKGWQKEMEWWKAQKPETQNMLLGKSLLPAQRKEEEQKLKKYYTSRLGIGEQDYARQKRDIENGVDPQVIPPRPPMHLMYYRCGQYRASSVQRWTNKLAFHARLRENLKYLCAKEKVKIQRPGNGGNKGDEEPEKKKAIMSVIDRTTDVTLKGFRPISQKTYQDMFNALNKYFLGETRINVKELLQVCKPAKKKCSWKRFRTGMQINTELKTILRNNNKRLVQRGRSRKILPRDWRPFEKINTEFEEVKRSIDILLFECLGPGFSHFCHAVQHHRLDVEEEMLSARSYKEDESFKRAVEIIENRMMEVRDNPLMKPCKRERELSMLGQNLNKVHTVVQRYYKEKQKKHDCILEDMCRDVEYIDNLKKRQSELPVPREFLSHTSVTKDGSKDARQLIASSLTSAVLMRQNPKTNYQEVVQEDSAEPKTVTSRSASLRKRKQQPKQPEAPWKKIRCKTVEEVNNERLKLPLLKNRNVTEVPYLPPTHCTLIALRALLLKRQELLKAAGDLYDPRNYHKNKSSQIERNNTIACARNSSTNRDEDGRRNVGENSFTCDSNRVVISCSNQEDKDTSPNRENASSPDFVVVPVMEATCSSSQKLESANTSYEQRVGLQKNRGQRFDYIQTTDRTLGQQLIQMLPVRENSAYEVSVGVSASSCSFKHIARTCCEKLPEDKMAPKPSTAVSKALHVPKITHKNLYMPEGMNLEQTQPPGDDKIDYEQELRTQMKAAADFTMNRFLRRKRVPAMENVVVVGVDPVTKNIVHFQSERGTDELTEVETNNLSICGAKEAKRTRGNPPPDHTQMLKDVMDPPEERIERDIIHAIRQTVEYKTFAARMHSLFMWPVLISTINPPLVPKLTTEEKAARPKKVEKGKRRYLTKDGRKDMKQKRKERREAREQAKREAKAAGKDIKIKGGRVKKCVEPKLPPEPRSRRPVRQVRLKAATAKAKLEKATPSPWSRVVPAWWKEAILEAMLTRQAIDQGKVPKDEKSLSEDEDFQDKGNYSDEEWLAPLLEQERKEKEAVRRVEEIERERRKNEEEGGGEEERGEEERMELDEMEERH